MKKRIYEIIELAEKDDKMSNMYDVVMMITIFISIIPLAFKTQYGCFAIIDKVTVTIFIIDYFARLFTADLKLNKGIKSYIYYPFTPMALIDLISILPSLTIMNGCFRLFKVVRLLRTFRVFRIFKAIRYSNSISLILKVFKSQKESLATVCGLAIIYVFVSALIILNVEPQSFDNYFDAVYWATVSLTTMGYGDIYPVTVIGRMVTMISSFLGIAIVALPAGIITSGLIEELGNKK